MLALLLVALCASAGRAEPGDEKRTLLIVAPESGPAMLGEVVEALEPALAAKGERVLLRVAPTELERHAATGPMPDLVVTLGDDALDAARARLPDVRRVFALAQDPSCGSATRPDETGVRRQTDVAQLLDVLLEIWRRSGVAPERPFRIGAFAGPSGGGCSFAALERELRTRGIEAIVARPASPRAYVHELRRRSREMDALFVLPAPGVMTTESQRFAILFGLETRSPVVAYSERLVAEGALLGERLDASAVARQTAELVERVLAGEDPAGMPSVPPDSSRVRVNERTARVLRLDVSSVPEPDEGVAP